MCDAGLVLGADAAFKAVQAAHAELVFMGTCTVGQHHRVAAIGVFEEVEDALFFHQAADEVEVAFAVLHAVLALAIGGAQAFFKDTRVRRAEDLLQDLGHRHLLEDAHVGRSCQQPQPGLHGQPVAQFVPGETLVTRSRDQAMVVAHLAVAGGDRHLRRFAQQVGEADRSGLFGRSDHAVLKGARDFFAAAHRQDAQRVPQRGLELYE